MTAVNDVACMRGAAGAALVAGLLLAGPGAFAQAPHAKVSLVAETLAVTPGGMLQLALHEEIQPGWHTYWINPGDSGLPTTIDWSLPQGFAAEPIEWPTPELFRSGALVNYGYEGDVLLPLAIAVPTGLDPGATVTLSGHANWLACAKICVPEEADVALTLPMAPGIAVANPKWAGRFRAAREAIPADNPYPGTMAIDRDSIELHLVTGAAGKLRDIVFLPLDDGVVDNDAEQQVETTPDGVIIRLARGVLKSKPLDRLNGVLSFRITGPEGAEQDRAIKISVPAAAEVQ